LTFAAFQGGRDNAPKLTGPVGRELFSPSCPSATLSRSLLLSNTTCGRLAMRLVTSDLREAIAAVSQVYCPHDVTVLESNRGIDAVLDTSGASRRRIVSLRYAAPVG
jgi:hypothetical protein